MDNDAYKRRAKVKRLLKFGFFFNAIGEKTESNTDKSK
jgi:hypothetical protein